MRIDLHCHTKKSKNGDSEGRNIPSVHDFVKSVVDAKVEILGITNHNEFDINQYNEIKKHSNKKFDIWPGIEFDVEGNIIDGNTIIGHVILICNPIQVNEFDKEVLLLTKGLCPDDVQITVEDVANLANKLNCIVMPHYLKAKSLDEDSIDTLRNYIEKKHMFFYEPSNYRSLGIMQNHDMKALSGSDNKNWIDYSENSFIELKLRVDSFEQFEMLSKKDVSVVDTLLQKKTKVLINISDDGEDDYSVPIYDDVNVIFGGKGTGKTFVLGKISEYYKSKSLILSSYNFNDVDSSLQSKLSVDTDERSLKHYSKDDFSEEFKLVSNWKEQRLPQIKNYIDYIKTKDINENKKKMVLFDSKEINSDDSKQTKTYNDLKSIREIMAKYNEFDLDKYLLPDEIVELNRINQKLIKGIGNQYADEWIETVKINFINNFIKSCNKEIERKTETKSKPNDTGFYKYAIDKLKLSKSIFSITSSFEYAFQSKDEPIGKLADDKNLSVVTNVRMLCKESATREFENGINDLKKLKNLLLTAKEKIFESEIVQTMSDIKTLFQDNETYKSCDIFLGIEKHFSIDGCSKYIPSTGEGTMIYLDEILDAEADVYILDEPEKSLGNDYVNEVIVERINELAKSKKTVVVATHNANIAVRTLPYTSILKKYNNGVYETYIGNPFINQLKEIDNSENVINWADESQKILEGGEEAFEERGEIYGR